MSKVFEFLAVLFLLFAGFQAYSNFGAFRVGAISPAIFLLSFFGPLLLSIAMILLGRNMAKTNEDRD